MSNDCRLDFNFVLPFQCFTYNAVDDRREINYVLAYSLARVSGIISDLQL